MEPTLVRLVWTSVAACCDRDLVGFSDSMLIQHLLNQLHRQILLNEQDQSLLKQYLTDRVPLIRDLLDPLQPQY
jgi:hypothetical protein